jgi:uncharacterized membrane protein YdbT with pleckstrin-like domain
MSYISHNLITDESITYRARLHWIALVRPLLTAAVFAGLGILLMYLTFTGMVSDEAKTVLTWVGAGLLIAAVILLISAWIMVGSAEFAVTNKRVILKTGFIQKYTAEMFLHKIESVGVDQSILGRVLGYGAIVIRGTGGSLEPFTTIQAPLEFRRRIQEQIGRSLEMQSRPAPSRP